MLLLQVCFVILLMISLIYPSFGASPPTPGPACKDCPNILLMFTDDQDEIIGGWDPMLQTQRLVAEKGARAVEWRIHTPICAPSRAQLQSGRYFHNIKSPEYTPSPKVSSGAVGQVNLSESWTYIFPKILREEKGYVTAQFGKCMNGNCGANSQAYGLDMHQMGAFDRWFEHAGFVNGTFFDNEASPKCVYPYDDSKNGPCQTKTFPGGKWAGRGDGYDTSTIGNMTVEWIRQVNGAGRPWFVYFAPHAPHSPATPSPWYEKGTMCDGIQAPRLPNWNYTGPHVTKCSALPPSGKPPFGKEPVWWWDNTEFPELTSCQPHFNKKDAHGIDQLAQKRCKALLSVDDSYAGIMKVLKELDTLENTYILVTSDHGYNLGHHMLPSNKFLVYEHSLRIPMLFMGPGIKANSTFSFLGTQVDLAPSILGLADINPPAAVDGKSVIPLLVSPTADIPASVKRHISKTPQIIRESSFFTYYNQGPWEVGTRHPLDDWSNTYIGVRYLHKKDSWKYAEYDPYGKQTNFTKPYMYQLFDLNTDPYELYNIYNQTKTSKPELIQMLHNLTHTWYHCAGANCM